MIKAKERIITVISMIAIALLILPMLAFGLGGNRSVNTCWQVNPAVQSNTGVNLLDSVIIKNTRLKVSDDDVEAEKKVVSAVYLFIGNVYNAPNGVIELAVDQSGNVKLLQEGSTTSRSEYSVEIKKGDYLGWVKIPLNSVISQEYIKISTRNSFDLYEVALVNSDGEGLTAQVVGGITTRNGAHKYYSVNELSDSIALVTDEQSGFVTGKGIDSLSLREINLIGAIDNLLNGKDGYVSNEVNAMGVALTAVGVSIFGNSAFGLRIMGFLFFIATLYLLFFFAKKLFSGAVWGAVAVALYMLSGIGISLVTHSSELSISIFFLLASIYFAYDFYLKSQTAKALRANSNNLISSGFTFAFALSISLTSLYVLPLLLLLCLIPSVRAIIEARKTFYAETGLEKEYARERYNKTLSKVIVKTLLGFVVAPIALMIIAYGIGYFTYTAYYETNLVSAILQNNSALFASKSDSFFFVWALGLGKQTISNAFGIDSYLIANRAIALASCVSLALIGLAYILLRGKSLSNVDLIVVLNENKTNYALLLTGFLITWFINGLFIGSAIYANFAICLLFAVPSLILLHKIAKTLLKKWLLITLTVTVCVIFVAFFVLQTPYTFNFDLSEKLQMIYSWLI